jgi:hypothetical protein
VIEGRRCLHAGVRVRIVGSDLRLPSSTTRAAI